MAEERQPPVYGLWNEALEEWFNPGTRQPYFPTPEAAHRMIPVAQRQYPVGKWEVREYPLQDPETPRPADVAQPESTGTRTA
ncbi:MAG TPA: hypothetical protein VHS99_04860 [Chloroflexota bacterium]|jgi:hypothetical protein|nr:hypothetical protein [Chloroflexota bacterium]